MATARHSYLLGQFVLEVTPPASLSPSSLSGEQMMVPPFELRFHANEAIKAKENEDESRQPWTATEAAAQRQWLTDTHRVWQSIAETPSEQRRDEYWMIEYALIVTNDGNGNSGRDTRAAKRRKRTVAATASTASTMTMTPRQVDSAPSTFRAVLAHPLPLSAGASAGRVFFRHDDEAKAKLRSFDKGFFGHFIDCVQQHNDSIVDVENTNGAGRLELLIGGSAPLAATCLIATFEPNDIDMYIEHINNAAIMTLDSLIRSLVDPKEEAVVLLRKPLTLTWAIYERTRSDKLPIRHRLQLNLLHIVSWAEVFAVYHSDLTCCGFDVTHNRFVVLYDRWYRFFDGFRPASAVSADTPQTSPSNVYRRHHHHHRRNRNNVDNTSRHSSSTIYFSNTWNLDSPYTLASAADKYCERGFKAHAIASRDAVLQPAEGVTKQLDLEVRHPLGGEMEMTMSAGGGMMYGVKLSPMPMHHRYDAKIDTLFLDRNDVVGWLFGLCMCRLYKVAVHVTDVLLPDNDSMTQPPPLLWLRWLGSRQDRWNTSSQPLMQEETASTRDDLSQQLVLFGLQPANLPWQLADEFSGRYGAAFLLAPLLLSLADDEYINVFRLRQLLAATSHASVLNSVKAAVKSCMRGHARPAKDDAPEVPSQTISAWDFKDLQFDNDMDEDDARVEDEIHGRKGTTVGTSFLSHRYYGDSEDDEEDFDDDNDDERDLRERLQVRVINGTYRYGLVQITRALIANGHLSPDRLTRFYPWAIRYFHALFLRHRRAVTQQLLIQSDDEVLPLHKELKRLVAEYV